MKDFRLSQNIAFRFALWLLCGIAVYGYEIPSISIVPQNSVSDDIRATILIRRLVASEYQFDYYDVFVALAGRAQITEPLFLTVRQGGRLVALVKISPLPKKIADLDLAPFRESPLFKNVSDGDKCYIFRLAPAAFNESRVAMVLNKRRYEMELKDWLSANTSEK